MSFKITITDNENNEVLINEENAVAIIGAVTNEENTAILGFTKCNAKDLLCAVDGTDKAKEAILDRSPSIALLYKMKEMLKDED